MVDWVGLLDLKVMLRCSMFALLFYSAHILVGDDNSLMAFTQNKTLLKIYSRTSFFVGLALAYTFLLTTDWNTAGAVIGLMVFPVFAFGCGFAWLMLFTVIHEYLEAR